MSQMPQELLSSVENVQTLSRISIGEKAAISSIDNTLDNFCQAAGANLSLKLGNLHYKDRHRKAIFYLHSSY